MRLSQRIKRPSGERRRTDGRDRQKHSAAAQLIDGLRTRQRKPPAAEQRADRAPCVADTGRIEQDKSEQDGKQHIAAPQSAPFLQNRKQYQFLDQQQHRAPQSPQHKVPICPVPESCCKPDDQNVEKLPPLPLPVAAERDIEIVAEPTAERNVPPPPEFRDARCDIRIVEILREPEAENAPQANGHVAVAGKVIINLQQKCDRIQPRIEHRAVLRRAERRHERAELIRQQDLLRQPEHEPPRAVGCIRHAVHPGAELRSHIRIADDWPGDQLREHRDIGREVDKAPLRGDIAAVDIDEIAHDLERVKADPDRERHAQQRYGKARQRVKVRKEKVRVFEIRERREAQNHGPREARLRRRPAPELPDQQTEHIPLHDRRQHHEQIPRLAPAVEDEARQQQNRVFQPPRREKIDEQHTRQKPI